MHRLTREAWHSVGSHRIAPEEYGNRQMLRRYSCLAVQKSFSSLEDRFAIVLSHEYDELRAVWKKPDEVTTLRTCWKLSFELPPVLPGIGPGGAHEGPLPDLSSSPLQGKRVSEILSLCLKETSAPLARKVIECFEEDDERLVICLRPGSPTTPLMVPNSTKRWPG